MAPLFINTPESMVRARIITLKESSEETLERLEEIGVLHVEVAKALDPIDKAAIESRRIKVEKGLFLIQDILKFLAGERTLFLPEEVRIPPLDEMIDQLNQWDGRCSELVRQIGFLEEKAVKGEELGRYLGVIERTEAMPLKELQYSGNYLFITVFVCPEEAYGIFIEKVNQYLIQNIAFPGEGVTINRVIAKVENRKVIEELAREYGASLLKIPEEASPLREYLRENDERIRRWQESMRHLEQELQKMIEGSLEKMVLYREIFSMEKERLSVLEKACEAKYVTLIEGWVPGSNVESITSSLNENLGPVWVDVREPEGVEEPPTKLQNPSLIRPFQLIVNLFSVPKYGDWDPTPIIAYSFAFFFGLMLNDVIYAMGLIFLAKFLLRRLVDDPTSEEVRLFQKVLYISGLISLIFGLVSGTYLGDFLNRYFGIELKTVALSAWVQEEFLRPIPFIIFSFLIGLVHVNAAHCLALIRGIRTGNMGLIFSKIGLFLTEIFGIPYLLRSLLHIEFLRLSPEVYSAFIYPVLAGVIGIIAGGFLQMGVLGGILGFFDLPGFLGDIMSYARLAGVGLATFYLASSFNLLADWLSSSLSNFIPGFLGSMVAFIVATLMLLLLHLFNTFLSSLAAFVHSLRLCFVEFLLKFYEGGGRRYTPFRLKIPRAVVVSAKQRRGVET
jgi:V/A-type H+-transporting ATPase subunit I